MKVTADFCIWKGGNAQRTCKIKYNIIDNATVTQPSVWVRKT